MISRLCISSRRLRVGSWFCRLPASQGWMCTFSRNAWPPSIRMKRSLMLTLPSRIDLTAVPSRARPASTLSSTKYSWKAARLLAIVSSPSAIASHQAAPAPRVFSRGHGSFARRLDHLEQQRPLSGLHRDARGPHLEHLPRCPTGACRPRRHQPRLADPDPPPVEAQPAARPGVAGAYRSLDPGRGQRPLQVTLRFLDQGGNRRLTTELVLGGEDRRARGHRLDTREQGAGAQQR